MRLTHEQILRAVETTRLNGAPYPICRFCNNLIKENKKYYVMKNGNAWCKRCFDDDIYLNKPVITAVDELYVEVFGRVKRGEKHLYI